MNGENVSDFLSGLITNSINPQGQTFAALLTPQGKIIADFFIHHQARGGFILDTPEKFGKTLLMRLNMYKLRAKIDIVDISKDYDVCVLWDGSGNEGEIDPRHSALGHRLLVKAETVKPEHAIEDYDLHRLSHNIPDSQWDFDSQQVFPADVNMDLLNGVDFKKGCFVGQEVVSRMHRKTEVRKRMCGLILSEPAQVGDKIFASGKLLGALNHVRRDRAIALVRLDRLAETAETAMVNDHAVQIMEPNYEPQS